MTVVVVAASAAAAAAADAAAADEEEEEEEEDDEDDEPPWRRGRGPSVSGSPTRRSCARVSASNASSCAGRPLMEEGSDLRS